MAAIIPNLCGASKEFNDFLSQFDDIEAFLLRNLDTAITTIKAQLDILFTDLGNFLRKFVGELPEFPSLNLQALIGDLLSIDISLPAGLNKYLAMVKSIADDFGEFLETAGFALETLISDGLKALTDGLNICGAIPDMRKTADGAFGRFSNAVSNAQEASKAEEAATINSNSPITEQRALLAAQNTDHNESLTAATDSTAITPAGSAESVSTTTVEDSLTSYQGQVRRDVTNQAYSSVTGARRPGGWRTSISDGELKSRANISQYGFATRPSGWHEEKIKTDQISGNIITLKHIPVQIDRIDGFSTELKEYNETNGRSLGEGVPIITLEKRAKYEHHNRKTPVDLDIYTFSGKEVTIENKARKYDGNARADGVVYIVRYEWMVNYDPTYTNK